MTGPFSARVGGVLSADIAAPDHDRELRFYARVLGTGTEPLWREDLMNNHGMPIIGVGARTPEHAGLPVQWMPHIQVADVASSVERALALGGAELLHGKAEDGTSQWAVLEDPLGVAFGVIPVPGANQIPDLQGDPADVGLILWTDLTVPDAATARDFYRQVVGWSVEEVGMTEGADRYHDYNMCDAHGEAVAGVCHARGVNSLLPSTWMLYLPVRDLDESVRRVEQEGGRILKARRGEDGGYAQAVVEDPVGAYVTLVRGEVTGDRKGAE